MLIYLCLGNSFLFKTQVSNLNYGGGFYNGFEYGPLRK